MPQLQLLLEGKRNPLRPRWHLYTQEEVEGEVEHQDLGMDPPVGLHRLQVIRFWLQQQLSILPWAWAPSPSRDLLRRLNL